MKNIVLSFGLASLYLAALSATAAPSVVFSETYADSLKYTYGAYEVNRTGSGTVNISIPFVADISTFNTNTPFELSMNNFRFLATLGDDPNYTVGKKSATLKNDNLQVTVSWTGTTLTVKGSGTRDPFGIPDEFGGETGPIDTTVPFFLYLGNYDASFDLYATGKNKHTTKVIARGLSVEEYDLESGQITLKADFAPPVITLSSPAPKQKAYTSPYNLQVLIKDWEVASVWMSVNGQAVEAASTDVTDTWGANAELVPGTNTVVVTAMDESENYNTVTNFVFYSVPANFTLVTNGTGTVSILPTGTVEIGRTYTVTAKPGANQVFAHWADGAGNVLSDTPVFSLKMPENQKIVATFAPNPFPAVKGTYAGVFADTDQGIGTNNAGYIYLTVTSKGTYSGKLFMASGSYQLSGPLYFNGTNTARLNSKVKTKSSLVDISLNLNTDTNALANAPLTGQVQGTNWLADFSGGMAISKPPTNISVGLYNIQLPKGTNSNMPGGYGYGSVTVNSVGAAKVTLHLADSSPTITFGGIITRSGQVPVFASLYGGKGLIVGTFTFDNTQTNSDLTGENFAWFKAPSAGTFYPAGFSVDFSMLGSRYIAPKAGTNIFNWTNGVLSYAGGNLPQGYQESVTYNPKSNVYSVAAPNANKASLTFTKSTGAFSGYFTEGGRKRAFRGVVLTKHDDASAAPTGWGYFLDLNQSGSVYLAPQP